MSSAYEREMNVANRKLLHDTHQYATRFADHDTDTNQKLDFVRTIFPALIPHSNWRPTTVPCCQPLPCGVLLTGLPFES